MPSLDSISCIPSFVIGSRFPSRTRGGLAAGEGTRVLSTFSPGPPESRGAANGARRTARMSGLALSGRRLRRADLEVELRPRHRELGLGLAPVGRPGDDVVLAGLEAVEAEPPAGAAGGPDARVGQDHPPLLH